SPRLLAYLNFPFPREQIREQMAGYVLINRCDARWAGNEEEISSRLNYSKHLAHDCRPVFWTNMLQHPDVHYDVKEKVRKRKRCGSSLQNLGFNVVFLQSCFRDPAVNAIRFFKCVR